MYPRWLLVKSIPILAVPLFWLPAGAAEKNAVSVEIVAYEGWKNNLRLSNGAAKLIVTLDVGPRIISYRLADGKNVFKEYTEQLGKAGEEEWQIRGGHRLGVAPEDPRRTFVPDNSPVTWKLLDERLGLVRIAGPADSKHGLQKQLDVQLEIDKVVLSKIPPK